jgi:hypothetical protein
VTERFPTTRDNELANISSAALPTNYGGLSRKVKHVKLTFSVVNDHLIFAAPDQGADKDGSEIDELAKTVASMQQIMGTGRTGPFDIQIEKPRFILVELDKDINWRFTPGGPGVTTKKIYGDDRHIGPWFTPDFGTPVRQPTAPENCRVLHFAFMHQMEPAAPAKFNFHISFFQEGKDAQGNPVELTLPLIFDPDIGNNGGTVPPP